jgi:hypothetical protein
MAAPSALAVQLQAALGLDESSMSASFIQQAIDGLGLQAPAGDPVVVSEQWCAAGGKKGELLPMLDAAGVSFTVDGQPWTPG